MARKAAYRAITELSEWMEGQRAQAEQALEAMKETQRSVWTPPELYDTCCPKWIAHGPEMGVTNRQIQAGVASSSRGCNGGCGKEHPRIMLQWRGKKTHATLSDALDPFVNYMEDLCQRGLAAKERPLVYAIDCFISEFLDQWKTPLPPPPPKPSNERSVSATKPPPPKQNMEMTSKLPSSVPIFGIHLLRVPLADQDASKRAQWRHRGLVRQRLENEQRQAKRLCRRQPPVDDALFTQALEVCVQSGLGQYLTIVDIAWMRLTLHPTMVRVAARLAKARLNSLKLSFQVLGCESLPHNPFRRRSTLDARENLQPGRFVSRGVTDQSAYRLCEDEDRICVDFTRLGSSDSYGLRTVEDEGGVFVPLTQAEERFEYNINVPSLSNRHLRAYMVRLFLDGDLELGKTIEVARYRVAPEDLVKAGMVNVSANVRYEVVGLPDFSLGFHAKRTETPQPPSLFLRNQPVPERVHENATAWKGRFSVERVRFNFTDLLGIHVRHRVEGARNNLQDIRSQRPPTTGEREYVRALIQEAGKAPGTNADWRGYNGWEWVP